MADPAIPIERRWNHNIERYPRLLDALPDPCGSVLDAGCGDGLLTWMLADRADRVLALDVDAASLERTEDLVHDRPNVEVRQGDVMTDDALEPASFDGVLAVAVLHHIGLRPGLERLASLVAPGGTLGIVGMAKSRTAYDLAHDAAGAVTTRVVRRRHGGVWEVQAPIADWTETYTDVLRAATMLLPGVRYRRHVLFRYSLIWTRPDDWSPPEPGRSGR